MSERNDNTEWAGQIIGTVFQWCLLILVGVWIICQWLTRLLLEFVINPLLDGALERHDGLVVLLSAGLWVAVALLLFPLLIVPELESTPPEEVWQALLITVGLGLAWGTSIGFWILLTWWLAVERLEPAYEPVQQLGPPVKLVSSPHSNGNQPLPSREELKSEVENIFVRVAEKERV
jgi:hypothetical protein